MQQNLKNLQNLHAEQALQRLKAGYPHPVTYRIALVVNILLLRLQVLFLKLRRHILRAFYYLLLN